MAAMIAGCRARPQLTPQEAEGKHLYDVRCAHCHEENDLALKKVPPDLHAVFKTSALPSGSRQPMRKWRASYKPGRE